MTDDRGSRFVEGVLVAPRHAGTIARGLRMIEAELRRQGGRSAELHDLAELFERVARLDRQRARVAPATTQPAKPATTAKVEVMTTAQAAAVIEISPQAVRKAAEAGRLPGERGVNGWLFEPSDVENYRSRRTA